MLSEVTNAAFRAAVQSAIERHLQAQPETRIPPAHASHALLPIAAGSDAEGACVIEPAVRCTHCGYCRSYGH